MKIGYTISLRNKMEKKSENSDRFIDNKIFTETEKYTMKGH